jgi:dTDP-4-dehydrorhamnose reductase
MILIFGKSGQLAQSFKAQTPDELDGRAVFVSSHEANFEQPQLLAGFLDHCGPEVVVICSAYTQVDKAEEERDLAEKINVQAPREIARWCGKNDVPLIHFSTDYVFNGSGDKPWLESDPTDPLNWYGETKLLGEQAIQATGCAHLIFRTSWVFSEYGKNFVKTMLRLGKDKEKIRIVSDQVGGPTYAPDLAGFVWTVIARILKGEKFPSGVYHVCGQGFASWADFAEGIFAEAKALRFSLELQAVERISTTEFPTPAQRPLNSRLDQTRLRQVFGFEMPFWRESLKLCLKRIGPS